MTKTQITEGSRVQVVCSDGRIETGTVHRITPFGAIDIHFDDDTYCVVKPSEAKAI